MLLQDRITEVININFQREAQQGKKRSELYNPYGRSEPLTEFLKIKVSGEFRSKLQSLPNHAEVIRLILENDLKSGKFPLRKPAHRKRGRGGDFLDRSGACEQVAVRVSSKFLEEIKQYKNWSSKAREALYEAVSEFFGEEATIVNAARRNP